MALKKADKLSHRSLESATSSRKAALLLAHIYLDDPSLAQSILSLLGSSAARPIAREMSRLGTIGPDIEEDLLLEFLDLLGTKKQPFQRAVSNPEHAKRHLLKSLESRLPKEDPYWKEHEIESRVKHIRHLLGDLPAKSVIDFFKSEHPQAIALALALAPAPLAARVLKELSLEQSTQLLLRVSALSEVGLDALTALESALEDFNQNRIQRKSLLPDGGPKKIAQLLEEVDSPFRETLLGRLAESQDPRGLHLSEEIRKELVSFEKISTLLPRDLARVIGSSSDSELALAIFNESAELQERLLCALSSRRRSAIEDASNALGQSRSITPLQQAQKLKAQKEIISRALDLHKRGEILFPWEEKLVF